MTPSDETPEKEYDGVRRMGIMVWLAPVLVLLFVLGGAVISVALRGGPLRLPDEGTVGAAAYFPSLIFALVTDQMRTRDDFSAGLRRLVLSEVLAASTYGALCAVFAGTLGDALGFAMIAFLMVLVGWGLGFLRWKRATR